MAHAKLLGYCVRVTEHRTGKVHVKQEFLNGPDKDPKELAEEIKKELMASWPQDRYLVYVAEILG